MFDLIKTVRGEDVVVMADGRTLAAWFVGSYLPEHGWDRARIMKETGLTSEQIDACEDWNKLGL